MSLKWTEYDEVWIGEGSPIINDAWVWMPWDREYERELENIPVKVTYELHPKWAELVKECQAQVKELFRQVQDVYRKMGEDGREEENEEEGAKIDALMDQMKSLQEEFSEKVNNLDFSEEES